MTRVGRDALLIDRRRFRMSRRAIAEVSSVIVSTGKPDFSHSLHVPFSIPSQLRNQPKSFILNPFCVEAKRIPSGKY